MSSIDAGSRALRDERVPVRLEIAALWVATMLLFAYGDILVVYRADTLKDITAAGRTSSSA